MFGLSEIIKECEKIVERMTTGNNKKKTPSFRCGFLCYIVSEKFPDALEVILVDLHIKLKEIPELKFSLLSFVHIISMNESEKLDII